MLPVPGRKRRAIAVFVAAGVAGTLALWYFTIRLPPIPQRPLRIGFEHNPPVQIRTDSGFTGLAVETVNEAAKRAGVQLKWVETGTSSDEAFQKGLVDLWPLMADLPDRRKRVHITRPWLHSSHTLLLRAGSASPDPGVTSRIALFKMPLHVRLLREQFPEAQLVEFPDAKEVVSAVCRGAAAAGFLEGRVALTALREKPADCASVALRVQILPDLTLQHGVGSTFEAAGAAEMIRREIGNMFRDGTLALTIAKYSYYGLNDTWASYRLMEAAERARWMAWGIGALVIALTVTLWRILSLRQRKRADAVLRESEERFRATFFQAAVGIAQTSLDSKWLLLNDRFCEMLGYTQAELREKSFLDITHPDDCELSRTGVGRLLAGEISSWLTEKRYVRKDGTIVWARLCVSLVRNQDNRPQYFISVVEDITERVEADRDLRDSEQRLALAQSAAHVGLWDWDLRTNAHTVFGEYLHLYGLPADYPSPTLEEWLSLIHPDDRERVQAALQESIKQTHAWDTEFRVVWPDGSIHWLLGKGTVFLDDSGQPVRMAGVNLDITVRKLAQDRLRTSERRLIGAQRLAQVGSWERHFEGEAIYWSDEMFRIFGLPVGPPLHFLTFLSFVHPDDREKIREANREALATTAPVIVEYRITRPDGEMRFVRSVVEVIGNDPSAHLRMAGATQDITDRKRAEEERARLTTLVEKEHERLNAIISSIPGAVWETSGSPDNPAKLVKFMSNQVEEMLGYAAEEWMTAPGLWPLIVHPDDRSRFVREATEIFTSDKGSGYHQYRCLTKDGQTVWLESHASAIREQTGMPIGLRGVTIDISERKEAQAALLRVQEELARVTRGISMGEVAASIAHEINQPLAAVVTNGEAGLRFLAASAPNIKKAKVILTSIISDGNRASEVIRRIRALFAKAAAHKEIFDLNQLIRDTILLLEGYAQSHNVFVRTHLEESLLPVFGDRTQLRQLLLNLVMNGIEAAGKGPHEARLVVIMTRNDAPSDVRLEVSDSGIGIEPGDRERIFHPFFTTKEAGLGMGLSISRTIVESHGGRILVEPNQPHGTRFLVLLPNERMT